MRLWFSKVFCGRPQTAIDGPHDGAKVFVSRFGRFIEALVREREKAVARSGPLRESLADQPDAMLFKTPPVRSTHQIQSGALSISFLWGNS
jgi:hypothetical protein